MTDLKHKRIENPGAHILAQIVKGTDCSGSWLLTGKGKLFDNHESYVDAGGESYIRIKSSGQLFQDFENRTRQTGEDKNWNILAVKIIKLLARM